jgi:hypothetical protein
MDDWVVLSDGSGRDTVSHDGSERGFAIVRARSDDGDRRAEHVPPVSEVPTASPPRVAMPHPTPPGSFKVVSYGDESKASSSRDASDGDESDEEVDWGVEDSDLDEGEEVLDAIAGLWIDDNDDDCFDLRADLLTSNTQHIARDGGEELEATASNADEELSEHRGGSYDDIDDGTDIVPSTIRPAPSIHYCGRTGCIACDCRVAKDRVWGSAEERRKPGRSYDDIDTSDEEEESDESDYEGEDDDWDGSKAEDSSCTEERSCDEDEEDSDIDSSEAEESDDDNSSDISVTGDSSDEDDETCSCNGGESSCDEDDDDACSSDEEESRRREDDHEDSDSSEDEESNYDEDDSSVSSNMEDSCDEDDDDTCSSGEEERSCDEDDEHSDTESSDEDEGRDSEEEDGTDSSGTTQSDCDEEEDDSDKSDATGSGYDDITDDSAEEVPVSAARGRSREERPTGPASEVKQREARETLDDALARVVAALESAPPRPRAVESDGASWRPPMPARGR